MYWPPNDTDTQLKKGTALVLRYRVLVHSGTHTDADIAGQFDKYKVLR
jgi:kynurenine formamidase